MNNTKRRSFLIFLKSFILSVLILLAVCSSVMAFAFTSKNRKPVNNGEENLPVYTAREDEAMNILVMVCPTRAQGIELLWLIRTDPFNSGVYIASIPLNTLSAAQEKTGTLDWFYSYGGINMTVSGVEKAYSIQVHRYVRADRRTFINFVDSLGGLETEVEEALSYKDRKTGEQFNIDSGYQTIDGRRLIQLFLYPAYEEGEEFRINLQSGLLTEFINQKSLSKLPVSFESLYFEFINLVDSNISAYDYSYRKKGFEYLCGLSDITNQVYISGYLTANDEFCPDTQSLEKIVKIYN